MHRGESQIIRYMAKRRRERDPRDVREIEKELATVPSLEVKCVREFEQNGLQLGHFEILLCDRIVQRENDGNDSPNGDARQLA